MWNRGGRPSARIDRVADAHSRSSPPVFGYAHDDLSSCSLLAALVEEEENSLAHRCCRLGSACLCPCLVLGAAHSRAARDGDFNSVKVPGCPSVGMGGLRVCIGVSPLCMCGWLCSPGMALAVVRQRQALIDQYTDTHYAFPMWRYCLLWPCILYQNTVYLERKERAGVLRFNDDYSGQPPPTKEIKVILIGPDKAGKTSLFRKLLLVLPDNRLLTEQYTSTGVRALGVRGDNVAFLTATDVPAVKLTYRAFLERMDAQHIDFILMCFDASDSDSWLAMLEMLERTRFMGGERLLVALKSDLIPAPCDDDDAEHLTASSVTDSPQASIRMAEEFAAENGLSLLRVSAHSNEGVKELLQRMTAPPPPG